MVGPEKLQRRIGYRDSLEIIGCHKEVYLDLINESIKVMRVVLVGHLSVSVTSVQTSLCSLRRSTNLMDKSRA